MFLAIFYIVKNNYTIITFWIDLFCYLYGFVSISLCMYQSYYINARLSSTSA